MSHGGMSPRGGLTPVDDVELGTEVPDGSRVPSSASASEPPPQVTDLGAGPRVVRADSLLGSALRTLLREHRARGGDADAVVAALASGGADATPNPPRSPRSDPASASPSSSLARLLSPGATGDGRGTLGVASHRAVDRATPANDASDGIRTPDRAVRGGDLDDLERLLEINRELRRIETRRHDHDAASSETPADGIRTRDAPDPDDDPRAAAGPGPGSQGFDLRAAARWLEHTVPAAAVVVAAFAARHAVGIVAFAWATAFLLRADALLRAQVALRAERSPRHVAWCVVMVATALAALAFAFPDDGFWTRLVFAVPASGPRKTGPVSFVRVLWETAMADTVARYVTVGAKAALIFATDAWTARASRRGDAKSEEEGSLSEGSLSSSARRRRRERERERNADHATSGAVSVSSATSSAAASLMETLGVTTTARGAAHRRDDRRDRDGALLLPPPPRSSASALRAAHRRTTARLSLLEHLSLAYRCVLPVPAWFAFFRDDDAGGRLVAAAATGAYLAVKIRGGVDRGARVIGAWRALRDAEARHGVPADPAEAAERGGECSICQERFRDPTRLRCGHVFCEECVGEWFERERTCPLCRAVIKTAAVATHGDGGTVMFAHVF